LAEDDAGDRPVLQQSTSTGSFQREREATMKKEEHSLAFTYSLHLKI
jgi:hypothetical protein